MAQVSKLAYIGSMRISGLGGFYCLLALIAVDTACGPSGPRDLSTRQQAIDDPNRFGTPAGWDGTFKVATDARGSEPPTSDYGTETWNGTTNIVGSIHLTAYSGTEQFATWTGTVTGHIQVSCSARWAPLNPGDFGHSRTENGGTDFTIEASAQFTGSGLPGGPSFLLTIYATDATQNSLPATVIWTFSDGPKMEKVTEYISGFFPQTPLTLPSTGLQINSSHPAEVLDSPCATHQVPGLYEVDLTPVTGDEMLVLEGGPGYDSWRPMAFQNDAPPFTGPPVSSRQLDTSEDALDNGPVPPGSYVPAHAILKMGDGSPIRQKAKSITFSIHSSSVPGEANNAPLIASTSKEPDLQFDPATNATLTPSMAISGAAFDTALTPSGSTYSEATVMVSSYDWGGYAEVTADAVLEDGTLLHGQVLGAGTQLMVPRRTGGSHVADVWKENHGVTDKSDDFDGDQILDSPPGAPSPYGRPGTVGDGLTLYEEYRGFEAKGQHFDTDPLKIDYFVAVDPDLLDVARPAVRTFGRASGLVVHSDFKPGRDFDVNSRVVNFNRDVDDKGNKVGIDQHLVLLTLGPPSVDGVSTSSTPGGPNTPGRIEKIIIDGSLLQRFGLPAFTSTVVHEMGHSVYVYHHGEDEQKRRRWTKADTQVTEVLLPSSAPLPIEVYNDLDGTLLGGDSLNGLLGHTILVSSGPGGPASGDEICFMRYNSFQTRTWNWSAPSGSKRYVTDTEKALTGSRFCSSPLGQTFNSAPGFTSRWGSATKGDCAHQIVVNDLYKDNFP